MSNGASFWLACVVAITVGVSTKGVKGDLSRIAMGPALRYYQSSLTAYDRHKLLINQYLLYHPGATELLKRDR